MNQFKKAKLRQIESGQPVESIADLQTAGIAAKVEIPIEVQPVEEKNEEILEVKEETIKKEPVLEPETEQVSPVPVPVAVITPQEQPPIVEVVSTTLINEIPKAIKIEKETVEQPVPQQEEPKIEIPIQQINETVSEPIIQTVSPTYHEPVISTARLVARNAAVVTSTQTSVSKKNIPNIFAPKDEAKSMRKSLVLKPTSVKKAENYCSKNGGSFNELIQTLLDNFIEEYGL